MVTVRVASATALAMLRLCVRPALCCRLYASAASVIQVNFSLHVLLLIAQGWCFQDKMAGLMCRSFDKRKPILSQNSFPGRFARKFVM